MDSNFQGYYKCSASVAVGRPKDITELSNLVRSYSHIKANGVGHSWWGQQFCSGNDASAVNIVTTEMTPTLATLNGSFAGAITVNEAEQTVTVAAGVSTRVLLDYLDKYPSKVSREGWTLASFPWFIDQTIGGAVATGSHGSTLRYGSLSSQLTKLQLVIADGSVLELTPEHGHLWQAARVSVGRLGVITSLTFKIVPNEKVMRTRRFFNYNGFQKMLDKLQADYAAAKATGSAEQMWKALQAWDETQLFWFFPSKDVWRMTYTHKKDAKLTPAIATLYDRFVGRRLAQLPEGAYEQVPNPNGPTRSGRTGWGPGFWTVLYKGLLRTNTWNGVLAARRSYLSLSETENRQYNSYNAYDQYEVAVPLDKVSDCFKVLGTEMYSKAALWKGFRSPALIRFVAGEAAYLSPTHVEPRMYINIEDHIGPNGTVNTEFQRVMQILRSPVCNSRMHWGKAGWPTYANCFDGAVEIGASWCHFGCAAAQLDPTNKFQGMSDVWKWQALNGGQPVADFASCCNADGFDTGRCTCAPRTDCQ